MFRRSEGRPKTTRRGKVVALAEEDDDTQSGEVFDSELDIPMTSAATSLKSPRSRKHAEPVTKKPGRGMKTKKGPVISPASESEGEHFDFGGIADETTSSDQDVNVTPRKKAKTKAKAKGKAIPVPIPRRELHRLSGTESAQYMDVTSPEELAMSMSAMSVSSPDR